MAKQTRTNLKDRAETVAEETILGANTALKIGQLYDDIIDTVPMDWESGRAYLDGEEAIWQGRIVTAFGNTNAGDSPESAPEKWIDPVIDSLSKLGVDGPNLPVLANALKEYVTQRINEVNEGGGVAPPKATIEMINDLADNNAYVTAYLVGLIITKVAELISGKTLQDILTNGKVTDIEPEFDGGVLVNLTDPPPGVTLINVGIDPATKRLYKGAGTTEPPPTSVAPNFIIFGHFIENLPDAVRASAPNSEWQGTITATPNGNYRVVGAATIARETKTYHLEEELSDATWRSYSGSLGAVVFGLNTTLAGVVIGTGNGVLDATAYAGSSDQPIQVTATVGSTTVSLPVTITSSALIIVAAYYAWQKNNPPTTASNLDLYFKISGTGDIEIATEVTGPPAFVLPKSSYNGLNTGSYANGATKRTSIYNAGSTSVNKLYVRKVGTTTDLLVFTLPALPSSGNVPITQFYPS
ncbi:hypothetical protein GO755_29650 [Spirosoma sp. HMF4905]|uniref:Uncharacterized protein n=1 Tax=Spirosoma arboris TaxID=2682092 RepID=A0A7K1SKA5_9BACT|nr:hypothetical protein [Spirosoma arboris]MVM34232.1 hypothetical protein [Spirosoma arboris]